MTKAPVRLLDDPALSGGERALLEAGVSEPPVDYDVGAGLARFRTGIAALGAAGAAATVAHEASAGTTSLLGKISLKLVVAVAAPIVGTGIAVGTVALRHSSADDTRVEGQARTTRAGASRNVAAPADREDESRTALPPSVDESKAEHGSVFQPSPPRGERHRSVERHARVSTVEPVAVHLEEESAAEPVTTEPTRAKRAEPVTTEATPRAERAEPVTTAPTRPSETVLEMQGIARARALLASDPAAAVAALEAVRREHPKGFFVEERRALTVLALARAGNRSAAREHAAAFLKLYPNGPFTDKVRAAIAP